MVRRTPKLSAGDLLQIPLADGLFAIGQILLPGVSFYLGVDPTPREAFDVNDDFTPRLFAWTNDAEVWRGTWQKLTEHLPVAPDFPRPNFKVGIDGQLMIESFEGQLLGKFVSGRDDSVNYRTSFSPSLVQGAVQAFNGNEPWLDSYAKMLRQQPNPKG